ncbi:hypothetical protein BDN71DRAFT_1435741 [Pleurotus eryngii]|uniref:Uncharacterized protein n=1 Tax=Pleurotus eryngii TaxID=5323 RepID=A0A9P5ZIL5_PLEER|nr:hypothetical protein BDN71DRAFT_1435741 [Pleurotus eryngii]
MDLNPSHSYGGDKNSPLVSSLDNAVKLDYIFSVLEDLEWFLGNLLHYLFVCLSVSEVINTIKSLADRFHLVGMRVLTKLAILENPSAHLSTAKSHEAPTDHHVVIHAWLEDNEDGCFFSWNLEYALKKRKTSADFKSFLVMFTLEDVCNILLGLDGSWVLRSIADLQVRKHLDQTDLVLEMFHDLVCEAFTEATVTSWGRRYYGSACTALWKYICYNFRPNPETPLTNKLNNTPMDLFYTHYVMLFQSSATVLKQDEFETLDYSKTVTLFRTKMTEGMKKVHNVYCQNFFKEIVRNTASYLQSITLNGPPRKQNLKSKLGTL